MELKTYFAQDRNGSLIPSATVAIYLTGTNTLASGLTTVSNTPLSNPFTADGDGKIQFRAPDGIYDMQVSQGSTTGVRVTFQCVDVEQQLSDANNAAARAESAARNIEEQAAIITSNTREQWRRSLTDAGFNLVDGSFEQGAKVTNSNDAVWYQAVGQCYTWGGNIPKTVPENSTPDSTGGVAEGSWASVSTSGVISRLSSESNPGAEFVSLPKGTVNDAIKYVTPEMFMSVAADTTAAIQLAFDNGSFISLSGRNWTIERTINIKDGTAFDISASVITSNVGASNHIFKADDAIQRGITVYAGAGLINGTAKSVFYFQGNSLTPSSSVQYARNIRIGGVYCSSDNIEHFIYMYGAVRQVFLNNCYAYVKGGIWAEGKIVEIYANNCMWYGSNSATPTDARLQVKAIGENYVPEGFHFTENLFDGVGYSWIVNDMYVMTVSGGYIGGNCLFGEPISLNHFITVSGSECKGAIIFTPNGNNDYRASIKPSIMHSKGNEGSVQINEGASGITVDTKLVASGHATNQGIGVIVKDGCVNCHVTIEGDQTYERLVSFIGSGARCSVEIKNYLGGSEALYTERPLIYRDIPVTSQTVAGYLEKYAQASEANVPVGSTIASLTPSIARGSRGHIVVNINASGMASGTSQALTISLPSGMSVKSINGVNRLVIRPRVAEGLITVRVPFFCTTDVTTGNLSLVNNTGNSINIGVNSYFGYEII